MSSGFEPIKLHTPKTGEEFIVEIEEVDLQEDKDNWLFRLKVIGLLNQHGGIVLASIKREHCPDHTAAIQRVTETPVKVLNSALEHWEDGNFQLHEIRTPDHWVIYGPPRI